MSKRTVVVCDRCGVEGTPGMGAYFFEIISTGMQNIGVMFPEPFSWTFNLCEQCNNKMLADFHPKHNSG